MKIAVFGATGFIGRNLVERLRKNGLGVLACDIARPPDSQDDFMLVDVTQYDEVQNSVKEASQVVFLAAHSLPESLVDPRRNLEVNQGGLLNVLDALRKAGGGRLLFASASSVYGNPSPGPVLESTACTPKTPYAVTKYASEHYLRVFHELYGIEYVAFRLFNVYGPGQLPQSKALIPRVLDLIMRNQEVEVFGDGSQSRDFIFVDDVSRVFENALRLDVSGEVVNLGTGQMTSIADVVRICGDVSGHDPRIKRLPARPGEISNFCADTGKLRSLLQMKETTGVRDGIRKTYEWLTSLMAEKSEKTSQESSQKRKTR